MYGDRGGDPNALRAVYKKVAYSLKARLYLHVAEASVAGVPGAPPAAYDSAAKYAALGISDPKDDFLWFHDGSANGANIWWQFMSARGDIAPAAAFLAVAGRLAPADVSTRIKFYFTPALDTVKADTLPNGKEKPLGFFGFRPGGTVNMPTNAGIDPGSM